MSPKCFLCGSKIDPKKSALLKSQGYALIFCSLDHLYQFLTEQKFKMYPFFKFTIRGIARKVKSEKQISA